MPLTHWIEAWMGQPNTRPQAPALTATPRLPWLAAREATKPAPAKRAITPFLVATHAEKAEAGGQSCSKSGPDSTVRNSRQPSWALKVIRIVDGSTAMPRAANDALAGRLRLSGRACEVSAELERMAA